MLTILYTSFLMLYFKHQQVAADGVTVLLFVSVRLMA